MTTSRVSRQGLIALAAAGLLDAIQLIFLLTVDDGAPPVVAVLTAVFGALTLAGVVVAWRGRRAGLLTAVAARIGDTVILGIPAFFLDAPWYALVIVVGGHGADRRRHLAVGTGDAPCPAVVAYSHCVRSPWWDRRSAAQIHPSHLRIVRSA